MTVPTMEKQTSWLKRLHLGLKKSRLCRRQISGSRDLKAQGVFGFWECCLHFCLFLSLVSADTASINRTRYRSTWEGVLGFFALRDTEIRKYYVPVLDVVDNLSAAGNFTAPHRGEYIVLCILTRSYRRECYLDAVIGDMKANACIYSTFKLKH